MSSLDIAATGMLAQQLNVEVTSNNLANLNTSGFKRVTTTTRSFRLPGQDDRGDQLAVVGRRDWSQGALRLTANPNRPATPPTHPPARQAQARKS